MTKEEFIEELETYLELEEGELKEETELESYLDSTATINIIALFDSEFDISVKASAIRECTTVENLWSLANKK
ncbi:MAG: hypothetical protein HQK84_08220 [Nitrospinae bacterium]|nr:hypothetical protein [Nitrospinota bacterium]